MKLARLREYITFATNQLQLLTFIVRVSVGEGGRAIALRFIVRDNSASRIPSAAVVGANRQLQFAARASLVRVTATVRRAHTFIGCIAQVTALGQRTARIAGAHIRLQHTLELGIAEMRRWARAQRLSIDHSALGIHATRGRLQARITARAGLTSLVRLAVGVNDALGTLAALRRFAAIAVRAQAKATMLGHAAHGVRPARIVMGARIDALVIDAGAIARTVQIVAAAGDAGSVLAQLPVHTVAGVAARTALAGRAHLTARALLVGAAALRAIHARFVALAERVAALQRQRAAAQRVAEEAVRAAALDHMVEHQAFGALATLGARRARILALVADARLGARAAQVIAASNLAQPVLANLSRAARRVAVADGFARAAHAPLVGQAVLVGVAVGLAHAAVARVIRRAFVVARARGRRVLAANHRVADQVVGTQAGFGVILHDAVGVGAARGRLLARVDAALVDARQAGRTRRVGSAAGRADKVLAHLAMAAVVVAPA